MTARAEASERLSGQIVASLTAGLVVTDLDGRVQILNPSSRRLLGLSDDVAHGPVREVLGRHSALAGAIEECLREGQPIVRRSIALDDPHAEVTHLGVTVSPLVDEGGAPGGVICLFTDLTKVMDLEEQLRLKDMLARLGELTAGLAHEFRNGLATIHGYARLMDLGAAPAEPAHVPRRRTRGNRLARRDRHQLPELRAATQLAVAPVDVGDVIGRVAEDVRADAEAQGGRVSLEGQWGVVERRRGAAAPGVQQPGAECRRSLCARRTSRPSCASSARSTPTSRTLRVYVTDNGPGIETAVARTRLPAVLHDQAEGHRSRTRPRAEDRRDAQRPRAGPRRTRRAGDDHARHAAALGLNRAVAPRFQYCYQK